MLTILEPSFSQFSSGDEGLDLLENIVGVSPDADDVGLRLARVLVGESLEKQERGGLVLSLGDNAGSGGSSSHESGGLVVGEAKPNRFHVQKGRRQRRETNLSEKGEDGSRHSELALNGDGVVGDLRLGLPARKEERTVNEGWRR